MRTIFTILLMLMALIGYSQKEVVKFQQTITDVPYNYFIYRDLSYNDISKELSIYGQVWKVATLNITKEGKNSGLGSGNTNVPFVYAATLKPSGENQVVEKAINLKSYPELKLDGYDYKALDPSSNEVISSSDEASTLGELISEYPKAFPAATTGLKLYSWEVGASWGGPFYVVETEQQYDFKDGESKLIPREKVSTTHKFELGDEYRIAKEKAIVDNKRRMAVVATAKGLKGDKLFGFKNKRIYSINTNGEITNQFDVTFEYPKSLSFASGLGRTAADTITNFEEGGIFIYSRAFGVGKKNNDPDKTKYQVVILNNNGELEYEGLFNYGTEKRSFSGYHAYKVNDKIFVFGKTIGKDNPGYAVLTFDNTGLIDTKDYPSEVFKTLVIGDYQSGLTFKYGKGFKPLGHYVLDNGQILIHGEAFETKSEPIQQSTPSGAPASSYMKTVYTYTSHVFLRIGVDGSLINEYVIPKNEEATQKEITQLRNIYSANNRVYLIGEEKTPKDSNIVLIKLDLGSGEIKKTNLSDYDIFSIRGKAVYKYDERTKYLTILGRDSNHKSFTLKSVIFELE